MRPAVQPTDLRDEATFDWGRMFAELCALPADADTGDAWDAAKYYCMPCVEALLQARLTAWWLARKRESAYTADRHWQCTGC